MSSTTPEPVVDPEPPSNPTSTAQSESEQYTAVSQQRRRLLPRAALVGLFSGLVAGSFRLLLEQAEHAREGLLAFARQSPEMGWLIPACFTAGGAVLSVFLVRRYAPEASGSGIPHLKAVLGRLRFLDWQRVLPVKFSAGLLALGSGLALGREGPTVQMGGAVGGAFADLFKSEPRERRTLIASGAGAGLAAAFNAPLSGLTFVLEEVQRDFHPIVFAAAFVAAVVGDIVARLISGSETVFTVPAYPAPPLAALPYFAVLGAAAGLGGVLFNRVLLGTLSLFARHAARHALLLTAAAGALTGLISWFLPQAVGSGHHLAESVLSGQIALGLIPWFFILRLLLTSGSYSTGAAGGIFAPLLVLGALLGLAVGQLANRLTPAAVPIPAVFAVVGMAAYFTAIVRAPLTGILLIVEMTGNYEQMLPLLVSCFCAYAVAEWLRDMPIYEALLERDLERNGASRWKQPVFMTFEVERGAPFDGREVRFLGLPPGCVLTRCVEDGTEMVPTASTKLKAYMKITAVVSPETPQAVDVLRRGCKASRLAAAGPKQK